MAALPTDIIRATRRARIVTREDVNIRASFPAAGDQANAPEVGFFETAADASAVLAIKAALTGTYRRRFAVISDELIWIDPTASIPTFTLVEPELGFSGPALTVRWRADLNAETTELEVLG